MGSAVSTLLSPSLVAAPQRGRILACLDRTESSEVCVPYAVSLARAFGRDLTLVHVMQPPSPHAAGGRHDAISWEIARHEALRYLERFRDEASAAMGRPVDIRLEQGQPAERIAATARELAVDMTVLGSHGQRSVAETPTGGTTRKLLAAIRTAVMIAPSAGVAGGVTVPTRILVPLDGSPRSESVLPAAVNLANSFGADLILAHVVQESAPSALLEIADSVALARTLAGRLAAAAEQYLDQLARRLAHSGPTIQKLVIRHRNERQGLLELARLAQADLVVLSAHGAACDSARALGNVTSYLLGHAALPLLVLQDLPDGQLDGHRDGYLHDGRDAKTSTGAPPLLRARRPAGRA
jgi:nucleotide-binding universal stress UspA family protein